MAKGGNKEKNNDSRFSKPYNASNSFVKKVASRVSGYLGGWFGTPSKQNEDIVANETAHPIASTSHTQDLPCVNIPYDTVQPPPQKRFKVAHRDRSDFDVALSPVPSTSQSGLFQPSVNHVQRSEEFMVPVAGPSAVHDHEFKPYKIPHSSTIIEPTPTGGDSEVKTNGNGGDASESSESTSGCSSLVPEYDRLSQSAFTCPSRRQNLEEKLHYARHMKQARSSLYLNRSIPASQESSSSLKRKHGFDASVYGQQMFDKSSVREKMVTSPFYTGHTSYGGASAYRRGRPPYLQRSDSLNQSLSERREGTQVQVKPAQHGSTEDLSNMSTTAKRILEALEQFSTPVSDAKRWPVSAASSESSAVLGAKRKRLDASLNESRLKLGTPRSPLNPHAGPVTFGCTVPTVPDLLKLRRLQKIQTSTVAARRVAVPKQEYKLPEQVLEANAAVPKEKKAPPFTITSHVEPVNLPSVPLPIKTLPKFDVKLPVSAAVRAPESKPPLEPKPVPSYDLPSPPKQAFVFSTPIQMAAPTETNKPVSTPSFVFSEPGVPGETQPTLLSSLMSPEAIAKLKRKPEAAPGVSSPMSTGSTGVAKTGTILDVLTGWKPPAPKTSTWECPMCRVRSPSDVDKCVACTGPRPGQKKDPVPSAPAPANTWECRSCWVRNTSDVGKCVACNVPKSELKKDLTPPAPTPAAAPASTWECSECWVRNKSDVDKCVACTASKRSQEKKETALPKPVSAPTSMWDCPMCWVRNTATVDKCAACTGPRPGQKKDTASPVPAPATGFGDKFKPPSGSWACKECFVTNQSSAARCVACESPKPGSVSNSIPATQTPVAPSSGFGDLFKKKTGQWDCDVCMISNKDTDTKCAACETPRPGSAPAKQEVKQPPKFDFGLPAGGCGFTFGIPPAQNVKQQNGPVTAAADGFTFGLAANKEIAKKEAPTEFKMPTSVPASSPKEKPGFALPSATDIKAPSFSFGSGSAAPLTNNKDTTVSQAASPAPAPIFLFGAGTTKNDSKSAELFTFGQNKNSPASSTASWGQPSATSTSGGLGFQFKATDTTPASTASSTPTPSNVAPFTFKASDAAANKPFGNSSSSAAAFGSSLASGNLFGACSAPAFGNGPTPAFGSLTTTAPAVETSGFASIAAPTDTAVKSGGFPVPSFNTTSAFSVGATTANTSTPAFTAAPAPAFGAFGTPATSFGTNINSTFGSNASSTPAFGTAFPTPTPITKTQPPADGAPFVFGAKPATDQPSAPPSSVFSFGAAKPEAKPPAFGAPTGQNGPTFNFGAAQPSANMFASAIPSPATPFGNPFGQNSAPAAFGATMQTPATSAQPFQFGAATSQPATAPAFSLSVPPSFNFVSGSTPPTFSATAEPSSQPRRVIKALRRTHR